MYANGGGRGQGVCRVIFFKQFQVQPRFTTLPAAWYIHLGDANFVVLRDSECVLAVTWYQAVENAFLFLSSFYFTFRILL